MMNESFGRAGYGEVSNQERQSADTLIDDDSQPIRIEFPRMQQTAQREWRQAADENRNAYNIPIAAAVTVTIAWMIASVFVNRFVRSIMFGITPIGFAAITVLVALRWRKQTEIYTRARIWVLRFGAIVTILCAVLFMPSAVRHLLDVPYLDMPKRVVITKPSVSYEEGTWHGATEAVNDLLDHTPESYYVQAQATPQHRYPQKYRIGEQDFLACQEAMNTRGEASEHDDGTWYGVLDYLPHSKESVSLRCAVGAPPSDGSLDTTLTD